MNYKYGIVVIGYNRIESISRLLKALGIADYDKNDILLIISLDYSDHDEIRNLADEYEWKHGTKEVVICHERIGLREHVLKCGNYLNDYDLDAIIVFEDDVFPSRDFFGYTECMTNKFIDNLEIAGISLYSPDFIEANNMKFYPLNRGGMNYFMQTAVSWGQVWFRKQWNDFYEWYHNHKEWDDQDARIPRNVLDWPESSWKKYHIKYCIYNNKYFVFPYISRTTCFCEKGIHTPISSARLQVSISDCLDLNDEKINDLDKKAVIYDAFYENTNLYSFLSMDRESLEIDLNSLKLGTDKEYLLSCRRLDFSIINSWADDLLPKELNILQNIQGDGIYLYHVNNGTSQLKVNVTQYNSGIKADDIGETLIKFKEFYGLLNDWLSIKQKNNGLADYFRTHNYNNIAIQGAKELGINLIRELKDDNINISVIIDKSIKDKEICGIPVIHDIDHMPPVDVIVVTAIHYYKELCSDYSDKGIPVVSLNDIVLFAMNNNHN